MTFLPSKIPLIQAPMAGAHGPELAIAVCKAGGLGSLPAAMLTPDRLRAQIAAVRQATDASFNVNSFFHADPAPDPEIEARWRNRLAPYYAEAAHAGGDDLADPSRGARRARDDATRLTNVFTGRPARGLINRFVAEVGPMCEDAPQFPLAAEAAAPLRTAAEQRGSGDFSPLWAGESAALARDEEAEALTRRLWTDAQAMMSGLSGRWKD